MVLCAELHKLEIEPVLDAECGLHLGLRQHLLDTRSFRCGCCGCAISSAVLTGDEVLISYCFGTRVQGMVHCESLAFFAFLHISDLLVVCLVRLHYERFRWRLLLGQCLPKDGFALAKFLIVVLFLRSLFGPAELPRFSLLLILLPFAALFLGSIASRAFRLETDAVVGVQVDDRGSFFCFLD